MKHAHYIVLWILARKCWCLKRSSYQYLLNWTNFWVSWRQFTFHFICFFLLVFQPELHVFIHCLHQYIVSNITQGGYRGFYSKNTITLTPKVVNDIHKRGGTILGTSRGGHDTGKIVDSIQDRGINQVYHVSTVL